MGVFVPAYSDLWPAALKVKVMNLPRTMNNGTKSYSDHTQTDQSLAMAKAEGDVHKYFIDRDSLHCLEFC